MNMSFSRRFLRRSRRSLFALSWFLLALLLGGCLGFDFSKLTSGEVKLPSWDVPVQLPIHYEIKVGEALRGLDGVDSDGGGLTWTVENIDPAVIEVGQIPVEPITVSREVSFEAIGSVPLSDLIHKTITFEDVPASTTGFEPAGSETVQFDRFTSVTFDSAGDNLLSVTIENASVDGFAGVGPRISHLSLELVNKDDPYDVIRSVDLVAEDDAPWQPTAADRSLDGVLDLGGLTLESEVVVRLRMKADGDPGEKGNLTVTLKLEEAHVSEATGVVIDQNDPVEITLSTDVEFTGDAAGFKRVEIAKGVLELELQAPQGSNIGYSIESLELDGHPLNFENGAYKLVDGDDRTTIRNDSTLSITLKIFPKSGDKISFASQDRFTVEASVQQTNGDGPTFSEFEGTFVKPVVLELEEQRSVIDWPSDFTEFLEQLRLGQVRLTMVVTNPTGFTGSIDEVELVAIIDGNRVAVGEKGQGWKQQLIAPSLAADPRQNPAYTTIELTQDNSDILDILNEFPDEFIIGGRIELETQNGDVHVLETDEVVVNFKFVAEMSFQIPEDVDEELYREEEPVELTFSDDDKELLAKAFRDRLLQFEILNRIPIGLDLELYFGHDKDRLYEEGGYVVKIPDQDAGEVFSIPRAVVDDNGRAIAPAEERWVFGFSEEEFEELFGTSPVYMGAIVKIPESERGKEITVTLGADDYLTINGHIEFIVRVNE